MNRTIVYPGAQPFDTDMLSANRDAMTAAAAGLQAVLGTATVSDGLVCAPTSPASLSVVVGPGSITAYGDLESSAYGSLAPDASQIVKQGINLGSTTFTLTAPATAGQSVNYLIEAAFGEADTQPVVLPYFNAADPTQPYSGPSNSGAAQYTRRVQTVQLQVKNGAPAATGTQTTPAVDAGWSGLWVVTVAQGQTTITSGSIARYSSSPAMLYKLPDFGSRLTYLLNQAAITPQPGVAGIAELYLAISAVATGAVSGVGRIPLSVKSSTYAPGNADFGHLIPMINGGTAFNLPSGADVGAGWWVWLSNAAASGTVTLTPNGGHTIDGYSSRVLYPGNKVLLLANGGTAWTTVAGSYGGAIELSITGGAATAELSWPTYSGAGGVELIAGELYLSGGDNILLQLGTGSDASPSWITTGYVNEMITSHGSGGSGDDVGGSTNSNGFLVGSASGSTRLYTTAWRITPYTSGSWHVSGGATSTDGHGFQTAGIVAAGAVTRLRLLPSGSNTISGGRMRVVLP